MTSVRRRLSGFLLLAALLTAVGIGLLTYRQTLNENEHLFDYQLRQIALSLRDHGGAGLLDGAIAAPDSPDVVIRIWTAAGSLVYLSHPDNPVPDTLAPGFADLTGPGGRWRVYTLHTAQRIIQVAQPIALRRDLAASAALRSLTPLLAFAPLMALMIWWLVGQSLSSLTRTAREVENRHARALDKVSEEGVPEEIFPLVKAINALLIRLRQAFAQQRAFVADAAHELRSPMTALRVHLQLLDRAADEASRREALQKLHAGVERAAHLIEQLLLAARTDPEDAEVALVDTDLAELVRGAIADTFEFATIKRIDMSLDAPDTVLLNLEPASARVLVRNLLDNAVRYTPPGGTVEASITRDTEAVTLAVDDSGPGIPEHERERVFDRFYRIEGNDAPGSGLGLSVVRNVAQRHGAVVQLGKSRLGGLRVTVRFRGSVSAGAL
ncbi:ATP-binding protein [Noviherbaspirillum sp. ST9]|uniref:ATP-binding protein n=1 Tax=Noviherbaspirillum sp. ST9 TaxID=3401606 RepID=UPI003B586CD7